VILQTGKRVPTKFSWSRHFRMILIRLLMKLTKVSANTSVTSGFSRWLGFLGFQDIWRTISRICGSLAFTIFSISNLRDLIIFFNKISLYKFLGNLDIIHFWFPLGQQHYDQFYELLEMNGLVCLSELQGGTDRLEQECGEILTDNRLVINRWINRYFPS
jgi:hypothetical protein